ncbi:hypothetical protein K474DRAFT_1702060 [Panus rudis PR-1116 ss-1]|nr:hypothetical protein K474DRAFT_1702060 [Panus rudis PR-1116 ss-1]
MITSSPLQRSCNIDNDGDPTTNYFKLSNILPILPIKTPRAGRLKCCKRMPTRNLQTRTPTSSWVFSYLRLEESVYCTLLASLATNARSLTLLSYLQVERHAYGELPGIGYYGSEAEAEGNLPSMSRKRSRSQVGFRYPLETGHGDKAPSLSPAREIP